MLNLLRKLRRKEMKGSKYLKYAVGEVFLVMIGILLAFQVNQWRDDFKQKKEEIQTIELLIHDLSVEKVNMEVFIVKLREQQQSIVNFLLAINNNYHPDSLVAHINGVTNLWNYRPSKPTYEGLKQNGKLAIIGNQEVRNLVIDYFQETMPYLADLTVHNKESHEEAKKALRPYFGHSFSQDGFWKLDIYANLDQLRKSDETKHITSFSGSRKGSLARGIERLFLDENLKVTTSLEEYLAKIKN